MSGRRRLLSYQGRTRTALLRYVNGYGIVLSPAEAPFPGTRQESLPLRPKKDDRYVSIRLTSQPARGGCRLDFELVLKSGTSHKNDRSFCLTYLPAAFDRWQVAICTPIDAPIPSLEPTYTHVSRFNAQAPAHAFAFLLCTVYARIREQRLKVKVPVQYQGPQVFSNSHRIEIARLTEMLDLLGR